MKPWTRIGPYVVGSLAGYILYKTECKMRIPRVIYFCLKREKINDIFAKKTHIAFHRTYR